MKKEGANKKLIIILVGIVVVIGLIIAALFFNVFEQTAPEQVYPIAEQCKFACDSEQQYSFCSVQRKVTDDLKATCQTLAENSQYSKYGVKPCPAISC